MIELDDPVHVLDVGERQLNRRGREPPLPCFDADLLHPRIEGRIPALRRGGACGEDGNDRDDDVARPKTWTKEHVDRPSARADGLSVCHKCNRDTIIAAAMT